MDNFADLSGAPRPIEKTIKMRKNIFVQEREDHLSKHVEECLFRFKELRLTDMISGLKTELDYTDEPEERMKLLERFTHFQGVRNALHKKLNRVL